MKGFTLIEVIVAVGIMVILLGLTIAGYRSFSRNINLETVGSQIVIVLDDARSRTLASLNDRGYGVRFQSNTYTLLADPNEVHPLPSGVEFASVTLAGGGTDVMFNRLTGTTSQPGSVVLRLTGKPSITQAITISAQGQAGSAGTVSPLDTRMSDTRHVHLDLGWTIQGTSTLTLAFSNPSYTENISMADFFNPDQTEFDFEGDVDVGGDSEHLRVQSHSIDATNTILSVERDRRDNQKAVAVAIDGREIISYAAAGTAVVGSDGGIMEIQ